MPRVGFTWDPTGSGKLSVRAAYGIFYDAVTNGTGAPLQAPAERAALDAGPPASAAASTSPTPGRARPISFRALSFPRPSTVLTIEQGMRPPYAQNWNFSVQRSLFDSYLLDAALCGQ